MCLCFILGIYEIFSKEVFGVKVKNLEFGLQPHKIPDTETVSLPSASVSYPGLLADCPSRSSETLSFLP